MKSEFVGVTAGFDQERCLGTAWRLSDGNKRTIWRSSKNGRRRLQGPHQLRASRGLPGGPPPRKDRTQKEPRKRVQTGCIPHDSLTAETTYQHARHLPPQV